MIFNIARQRGPKGPERSPGPCQMSPNHAIRHVGLHALTLVPSNFSRMDFLDCPLVTGLCRLTYSSTTKDASPNEYIDPELCTINRPKIIYSFLGSWPAVFPGCVISSHACIVLLSDASSSSHVLFSTSCVSTDPWAPKRGFYIV